MLLHGMLTVALAAGACPMARILPAKSGTCLPREVPVASYPSNVRFYRTVSTTLVTAFETGSGTVPKYAMMPHLVSLGGTELLAIFARGLEHGNAQDLRFVRSLDNGLTWGSEVLFPYNMDALERGSPMLVVGGVVYLAWRRDGLKTVPSRETDFGRSDDGGLTWTRLVRDGFRFWTSHNDPGPGIVTIPGGFGLGVYGRNVGDARAHAGFAVSIDAEGTTWRRRYVWPAPIEADGYKEPAVGRLADGRLMALLRQDDSREIRSSFSSDNGVNWTAPVKAFPGWNWPTWIQLSTGRLLAFTRHSEPPFDGRAWTSIDAGATWAYAFAYQRPDYGMQQGAHAVPLSATTFGLMHCQEIVPGRSTMMYDRWVVGF